MPVWLYWTLGVLIFIGLFILLGIVIDKYGNDAGNPVGVLLFIFIVSYSGYGLISYDVVSKTEVIPQSVVVDDNKQFKTIILDDGTTITLRDAPSVNNPVKVYLEKRKSLMGLPMSQHMTEPVIEKKDSEKE